MNVEKLDDEISIITWKNPETVPQSAKASKKRKKFPGSLPESGNTSKKRKTSTKSNEDLSQKESKK